MAANESLVPDGELQKLKDIDDELIKMSNNLELTLTKMQLFTSSFSKANVPFKEFLSNVKEFNKECDSASSQMDKVNKKSKEREEVQKRVVESTSKEVEAVKQVNQAYVEQEKTAKNLEQATKQLLATAKETAKGIDISAYIQRNENGMVSYSDAINAANQQLGRIEGLQEALKKSFEDRAISESEYSSVISELTQRQAEYGSTLEDLHGKYEKAAEAQRSVFDPASDAFGNLTPKVQEQTISLIEMNVELNNIKEAQKNLDKSYKDGEMSLSAYAEKKAQLSALESDQSKAVKNLSKELQLNSQIANTAVGSYDNLSARYSLMKIEINALGEAEGQNVQQKRALEKEAKALYERMNDLQKATGKSQLQVGDYTLVNRELTGALNTVSPALSRTVSGIQSVTKASLAFIATPVGLVLAAIAAALATLSAWFTRTEEGQNALAVGTAAFEKVLNAVLNVASEVGEWLYKAFTSPKEAITELGNILQEQIINRFKAIGLLGEAIVEIFTGDWKKGVKDLGNAYLQMATGVEDVIGKTSDWMNETYEGAKRAADIQSKMNDLATKKRDLSIEEAESLSEMNKLRNIANDQEKSASERLAANNKYIEIANRLGEKNVAIAKETYELRKAQIEENKRGSALSIEEKDELAKLEADMYKAESDHQQKLFTATRTNNRLRKEGIAESNKELKASQELAELYLQREADAQKKILENNKLGYNERMQAANEFEERMGEQINQKRDAQLAQENLTKSQIILINEKADAELTKLSEEGAKLRENIWKDHIATQNKVIEDGLEEQNQIISDNEQQDMNILLEKFKTGEINQEEHEKRKTELTISYAQARLQAEIDAIQKMLDIVGISEEERASLVKKLRKTELDFNKSVLDQQVKSELDAAKKREEAEKKLTDAKKKLAEEAFNFINSLISGQTERQLNELEIQQEQNSEWRDEELARIEEQEEKGVITKEQAEAQKWMIDEQAKQRDAQIEEQKKKTLERQAKYDKAAALAQVAISTAQSVMKNNALLGFILAAPINAMTIATGALQAATIAAQPIPKYKRGTDNHPGGLAVVGDGGRHEMVVFPDKSVWKTPSTDTLVDLPKGAQVLPDFSKALVNMSVIRDRGNTSPLVVQESKEVVSTMHKNNRLIKDMTLSNNKIAKQLIHKNNNPFSLSK